MRTEQLFSLCGAILVALQVVILNVQPFTPHELADNVWHVLAYSSIGLLLWIAIDGNRFLRRR